MKPRVCRFGLLALTLAARFVSATEPALSLHAPGNLQRSIDQYLADYRTWKNTPPPAPKTAKAASHALQAPSFEDELKSLLEGQNFGERPVDALGGEISLRGNGGTVAERFLAKIGMLSENVTQAPGETYDAIVAALLADYLENPQDRDALVPLLRAIGDRLPVNPAYDTSDPILDPMRQGTMLAYVFIVAWDWRGGLKGLTQDAQGLGAASKQSIASASEKLTALFRKIVSGGGEAKPLESAKRLGIRAVNLRKNLDNPLKGPESRAKLLASLKTHAHQLGRSFLVGGIPGALLGANCTTEPPRIHPLDGLVVVQALAIARLETEIIDLKRRARTILESYTDPRTKRALLAKARADGDKLRRFVAESRLQALYEEFAHFTREAKKFQGQNEYPDLARRLRDYRKPTLYYRRSAVERVTDLVAVSEDLTRGIEETDARVTAAKPARGLTDDDTLNINLIPIQANLSAAGALVQAIQILAGPAPQAHALPPKH